MASSNRRRLILGGAALFAAGAARAQPRLAPTPRLTEGPYYPDHFPLDTDADLVQQSGLARAASGEVLLVSGRILDSNGRPIPDAVVEIWQADTNGRYIHTYDRSPGPRDDFFQGFGKARTDAAGKTLPSGDAFDGRTHDGHVARGKVEHSVDRTRIPGGTFAFDPGPQTLQHCL